MKGGFPCYDICFCIIRIFTNAMHYFIIENQNNDYSVHTFCLRLTLGTYCLCGFLCKIVEEVSSSDVTFKIH